MMIRKFLFLITCLSLFTVGVYAQSGYRTMNAGGIPFGPTTSQVSLNNAWFGSSFSYKLTGDADFNKNFLFNTNVLYNIKFDSSSWNFPVVGNIALPLSSEDLSNLEVGVYPFKVVSVSDRGTIFVIHGGVQYSIIPGTETELSPQLFKVLAGVEVSIPLGNSALPFTVSLTPTYENRNLDRGNNLGLEGTFIIPVAANLGLIGELNVPFKKELSSSFSAGVVVNGAIGN